MLSNRIRLLIKGLGTRYLCSSNMADLKGSALVILAEGAEEMEAVITTDVLRRGKVSQCTSNVALDVMWPSFNCYTTWQDGPGCWVGEGGGGERV